MAVLVVTASCAHTKEREIWVPDFIGEKPVVLDFFFNSCEACNDNEAELEELLQDLGARVVFKAIEVDCDDNETAKWIAKHHPTYEIIQACDDRLQSLLEVSGFPTLLVLSHDGRLLLRLLGRLDILSLEDWHFQAQRSRVLEILKREYPADFRDL